MTRGAQKLKKRPALQLPAARPLLQGTDHGDDIRLDGAVLGTPGDRWIDAFLDANAPNLARLGIQSRVEVRGNAALLLTPGSRIGAVPLLSPITRRVAAGLLIKPRFRWSALGAVLGDIGFAIEASVGGGPLVPGSAREVPMWLLAAPVLGRLEGMLAHRKRSFVERSEQRQSPRGRIDWSRWASQNVPSGRWAMLPCHFPDPDDDPDLLAAVRWTLQRLHDELAAMQTAGPARLLLSRIADLRARVGPGKMRRPSVWELPASSAWVAEALEAMGWVAEDRGLGGSRSLDGLSWDLATDELWEAWVDAFVANLGPHCGLVPLRRGQTRKTLNWRTPIRSMGALIPDSGLRSANRVVWIDAKYKSHFQSLANTGWEGLAESTRNAHRADLHQALAYASLEDVERVDSILVYPELAADSPTRVAAATIASGRRQVRLFLVGLPFGFSSEDQRDQALLRWREMLAS